MTKIDQTDKEIFYELDVDARQTLAQLAKKLKLTENIVQYRVKKLKSSGIIKYHYTVIDTARLGYTRHRLYLKLQYRNNKIEREIIQFLVKHKNVGWVASTEGEYNLVIIIWVRSTEEFQGFWSDLLKKYQKYIKQKALTTNTEMRHYSHTHLFPGEKKKIEVSVTGNAEEVKIKPLDKKILRAISEDARIQMTDLAKKLNTTQGIVTYRIKKLEEKKVIQAYRTYLSTAKDMGKLFFELHIHLEEYKEFDKIIDFLKKHKAVTHIEFSAGIADIKAGLQLKSLNALHELIQELRKKFHATIKKQKYLSIITVHKYSFIPDDIK